MNLILADIADIRENLLPLSFTRPVSRLRVGITTIEEKWASLTGATTVSHDTVPYLREKFPVTDDPDSIVVAGHIIPSEALAGEVLALGHGEALTDAADGSVIAMRGSVADFHAAQPARYFRAESSFMKLTGLPDIFLLNGRAIEADYLRLTAGLQSQQLPADCTLVGDNSRLYIAPGAKIHGATLNTLGGPIYLGPDSEVMEGACLRGPIAVGEHSNVNMGTKIYGATTLGPYCKVGGELNNVVILGYSNKAHDGFLGNAVIGKWCNLGAGCTASNLKNDYSEIRLWNYPAHRFLKTGLQFCGLIMGDHSKAGINTMFNTATVVGVGCNIHGTGFPRTFIPSFSEGGAAGFTDVALPKFFATVERVVVRRGERLTDADRRLFESINAIADTYK